jgi:hypothetical protein
MGEGWQGEMDGDGDVIDCGDLDWLDLMGN